MNLNIKNNNYQQSLLKEFQQGKKQTAIKKLQDYLKKNPQDTIAHYNLGVMYQAINKIEESISEYNITIKRDKKNWRALSNLGLIYFTKRLYKKSNIFHMKVLKLNKDYQPALRDIGTNFLCLEHYKTAENFLTKSLKLNSIDYINMNSLGLVKLYLDKFEEAKILFEKSISTKENYYVSYNNLGLYYERFGEIEKAFNCYKKCLNINPNYPNALNNIGMLYFYFEENIKAFSCFHKAIKIDPSMVDLYFNLGLSYFHMRKFNEAEKYFRKGFKISPKHINGHYNYSFMLLAQHNYKKAWEEFDYRIKRSTKLNENFLFKKIENKIWTNQDLTKNNLLIVREQGVGDEILYSSMYKELIKSNKKVKIETDPRLIELFKRSFDSKNNFVEKNSISQNKNYLKDIDVIIFAGSLGKKYRKSKMAFPKKCGFLKPKVTLVEKIKSELNEINQKPKIGISWISKNKRIGKGKSMTLMNLLPLLKNDEVSFVNLQYGESTNEINKFQKKTGINIINLKNIDKFNDFESLSALLKSLDLFITVSNTTAHLSGAIGQATWVMAPKSESLLFYWNTGEENTPWYPSVRIFPKKDSWNETLKNITINLRKWIKINSKN
ncbi:MAG: TPR repeat-containing protein YrrB [Alphaproteobacteria bacterium MarineAlpha5_Bin11]|nr:hypothetical protein [Pelagibacteraceae bacterium]PPR43558.1 MAG: TPR repeat-containing protein YrrB [Alphaproteobacteria bacterium MarineAlpha5_Bin11]PPR51892.1 MAG: TPR repeat-containing protein YrrB [Alphaproteobacteria bacterium MarineAlpha5_Bin10]|tara:strand:+ start:137 stop:1963 length:1827 start_codon:yes stop_codon:yes gene_type:complete